MEFLTVLSLANFPRKSCTPHEALARLETPCAILGKMIYYEKFNGSCFSIIFITKPHDPTSRLTFITERYRIMNKNTVVMVLILLIASAVPSFGQLRGAFRMNR